jgi:hypothetical protein
MMRVLLRMSVYFCCKRCRPVAIVRVSPAFKLDFGDLISQTFTALQNVDKDWPKAADVPVVPKGVASLASGEQHRQPNLCVACGLCGRPTAWPDLARPGHMFPDEGFRGTLPAK